MFWKRIARKAQVLDHRFLEIADGHGIEILHIQTSKSILPAKPGYSFEIVTKKEPK
ncbi:hypothetical protein [Tumebacillus permanentifrigoris]|uniref:Uncharacterized protein n=1 Tax=Tumebacillus permanentifrigoris TaxID=378543 RepID=A0A316D8A7_9BACL|nr:hypothetical protein [Tumebacillus permanentifrigoris]PWK09668.1 hypothetical protein C7459_113104 [Tumebacillus permanentifrigoris]